MHSPKPKSTAAFQLLTIYFSNGEKAQEILLRTAKQGWSEP